MNQTDILGTPEENFSLPSGFFQNPGNGSINPGLKPANSGVNLSGSKHSAPIRPQNSYQKVAPQPAFQAQHNHHPAPTFSNPNNLNPSKTNNNQFGHQNPFIKTNSARPVYNQAPQNTPNPRLPIADGRYPHPNYPPHQNLINNQNHLNLPPHPNNLLLQRQNPQYLQQPVPSQNPVSEHHIEHQRLMAESQAHIARENHYTNTLITAVGALFLYFVGSFIIIFTSNVGGQTIVNLPTYSLTWELLFSNPAQLFTNLFLSVFGYFFQYARLFGFFPELGNLTVQPVARYLMPVDILIKLGTILYFNFRWMPWDTRKRYEDGCFNTKYPYLKDEEKASLKPADKPDFKLESINIPAVELEKNDHKPQMNTNLESLQPKKEIQNQQFEDDDDEENEQDHGILPFSGVQKPIEEWYYENEVKIYGFIRTQILPGSNMVLALYFSTLRVLDLRQPAFILFYVLGIMSMFWCMQTFLLILDHNQYPPDEE